MSFDYDDEIYLDGADNGFEYDRMILEQSQMQQTAINTTTLMENDSLFVIPQQSTVQMNQSPHQQTVPEIRQSILIGNHSTDFDPSIDYPQSPFRSRSHEQQFIDNWKRTIPLSELESIPIDFSNQPALMEFENTRTIMTSLSKEQVIQRLCHSKYKIDHPDELFKSPITKPMFDKSVQILLILLKELE